VLLQLVKYDARRWAEGALSQHPRNFTAKATRAPH
jgi:hypothetical protein